MAYRSAAAAENEPLDIAIYYADKLMRDIIETTQADSFVSCLSGKNNFRKTINPLYKANRDGIVKPRHLKDVRQFIISSWAGIEAEGCEADDVLGMMQGEGTVIATIDKDLLQVPGRHYNFVKGEFIEVDELTGLKSFYKQALIGDRSDNIFGVDGIGKVKAGKLIDPLTNEKDMYNTVCKLYNDPDRLDMNLDCLWIWRHEEERWSDRFAF